MRRQPSPKLDGLNYEGNFPHVERRIKVENLKIIENGLVPVYTTSTGEKVVYGTELYKALGSKQQYTDWIKARLEDVDAVENEDYVLFHNSMKNPKGGRPTIEYTIRLDTAKEMSMLERNEVGKRVRKYFIRVEKKYKDTSNKSFIEQGAAVVKFIADDLRVNDASRMLMYENYCKDVGIPTNFLPKYEFNGNHELKAATTLLKANGCSISVLKFNELLSEHGYLETRERPSSKGESKKYKALTDKGLQYGENAVNSHNQKEVQPLYYVDKFMELYDIVTEG